MSIPEHLQYTAEHEWVREEDDGWVVGITHHAQDQLGDVVFVELPEVGAEIIPGDTFGTVESVKAVSDLFAPIQGKNGHKKNRRAHYCSGPSYEEISSQTFRPGCDASPWKMLRRRVDAE